MSPNDSHKACAPAQHKECPHCHQRKPLEAFHRQLTKRRSVCAECRNALNRLAYAALRPQLREKPDHHTCYRCQETKPFTVEHFHRDLLKKHGLAYVCKVCQRVARRELYYRHRDRELARMKVWKTNNRERYLEYQRLYQREYSRRHREALSAKRRARVEAKANHIGASLPQS